MARTLDSRPYTFEMEYLITGYHIYKDNWQYTIGEEVRCEREPENVHDPAYAVRLTKGQMTIGHIPRDLSKTCTFIILSGGVITAKVIGRHQNKRNNGLEIPCIYLVKGPRSSMVKAECIIKEYFGAKKS